MADGKRKASAFTLIVTFICIALAGLSLLPLLPVKLSPSHTLPGFTVSFSMPGSAARVVEMEATSKLEAMLARIKGVRNVSSTSGNGWGSITIDLDKHVDPDIARFEASTVIRQVWSELPDGVGYPYLQMKHSDERASRPFIAFTLNAPSAPFLIQQYAEEHIKNRLARIPGIYKIDIGGATPMEWRLEYDSHQLDRMGVSLQDIRQALSDYYRKEFFSICPIENASGEREWIRLALMPGHDSDTFDASAIEVKTSDGKIIRLNELVIVSRTEEEPQSYYRINGLNSIYLSVAAEESANQLELSKQVIACIEEVEEILPPGYEIHLSYDTTEFIRQELDKIYFRTGLTVLILLVFVLLITRNPKYLLLIVTSLAVNMAVSVIFYYLFGLEMQLYSLAGITVSLNLVIDNFIVMTDHILHRRNMKAFVSILAATLTTMGALVAVFFLDERIRLNLQDFALVVMINLAVSLFVALFFVPAMIEKTGLKKLCRTQRRTGNQMWIGIRRGMHRFPVYFTRGYAKLICFLCRWRIVVCLFLLLLFGFPVFLLPDKIDGEGWGKNLYNRTFGNDVFKENVKPMLEKVLGGTLRLFAQKVYEGSYFTRNEETVLYANVTLPNGSTLEQMNELVKKMETYLSNFKEIKQFQTDIQNARRASIAVYFTKEHQKSNFPYVLRDNIVSKALQLGGGSWSVYGLPDRGFSNDVREEAGAFRIKMYGYNYDELAHYTELLKEKLLTHRRIKEIAVRSEFSYWKDDYQEFFFRLNHERMAWQNVSAEELFSAISPMYGRNLNVATVITEQGMEAVRLSSRQSEEYDVWAMRYVPYSSAGKEYKLSELASVEKEQAPQQVVKENQQYRLCLQYKYIGSREQGQKILRNDLEEFNKILPMGYMAESDDSTYNWGQRDTKQYMLLLFVIAIIFFITSILFNSIKQPLAIIFVIPISYIGVFLTFYCFHLNFDQGGFASFILLCGITVNASIYVLNEYNSIRHNSPRMKPLRAYVKAWNRKSLPIFLTVVSTILGFVPFMVGADKEAFWFPLAAGTIGGLIMSVVGIFLFLPILTLKKKNLT